MLGQIALICKELKRPFFPAEADTTQPESLLRRAGLLTRRITLEGKWWEEAGTVLLCTTTDGKPLALFPGKKYYYYEEQEKVTVNRTNANMFRKDALCVYLRLPDKSLRIWDFFRFLGNALSWSDVLWLLFISLLASLVGLLIPEIVNFSFSSLVPSGDMRNLVGIGILFFGIAVTSGIFSLTRLMWISRIGNKLDILVHNAVWGRILSLPASFFRKYEAGDVARMAGAADTICQTLSSQLVPTLLSAIFSVVYLFQINRLAPALLIPSTVVVLLLIIVNLSLAYFSQHCAIVNNNVGREMDGFLFQLLRGRGKLQIAGAEERAFSRWAKLFGRLELEKYPAEYLFLALSGSILLGGTIWFYAVGAATDMSVSAFIASQTAFSLYCGAVLQISDITAQLSALRPSAQLLAPILKTKPDTAGHCMPVERLLGDIQLEDVSFRYTMEGKQVISHLNLHIHPGEYVGIAGSSGCGKSTLLRLLLGFETPDSGAISYDGRLFGNLDVSSVRRRIGTVLQDGMLFPGDIISNIAISNPDITLREAWEAAEKSGFAKDIREMPLGMYSVLSENGSGLSGGQKQRLLITRALAQKPDILILDEATSALDNRTQEEVIRTFDAMGMTRIVVAHRLSTLKSCNRIIYLSNGAVAEEGTYEELMAKDGLFAQQAKRQIF